MESLDNRLSFHFKIERFISFGRFLVKADQIVAFYFYCLTFNAKMYLDVLIKIQFANGSKHILHFSKSSAAIIFSD